MRVYRWDLDKTYLETDFDSVRSLVRTALEPAAAKRAVPGARALLGSLSTQGDNRIAILSGSPTQMRRVLSEKLSIDGIRFDELKLKDNLGNLKRGRVRALREQVGYKLPALLEGRFGLDEGAVEVLFGDDAEVDALVYSAYADVVAGRLEGVGLRRFMAAAGAYEDQIGRAIRAMERLERADPVERIFIHLDRGLPVARFSVLGPRVVPVQSWFQAALILCSGGHIHSEHLAAVAMDVMQGAELQPFHLANLVQDIVRRGHLSHDAAYQEVCLGGWAGVELQEIAAKRLKQMKNTAESLGVSAVAPPDYVRLVRGWAQQD